MYWFDPSFSLGGGGDLLQQALGLRGRQHLKSIDAMLLGVLKLQRNWPSHSGKRRRVIAVDRCASNARNYALAP